MRRQRDTHARPRPASGGRLAQVELVRQDLKLSSNECQRALQAKDAKEMRAHVELAHKFLLAAAARLK